MVISRYFAQIDASARRHEKTGMKVAPKIDAVFWVLLFISVYTFVCVSEVVAATEAVRQYKKNRIS